MLTALELKEITAQNYNPSKGKYQIYLDYYNQVFDIIPKLAAEQGLGSCSIYIPDNEVFSNFIVEKLRNLGIINYNYDSRTNVMRISW